MGGEPREGDVQKEVFPEGRRADRLRRVRSTGFINEHEGQEVIEPGEASRSLEETAAAAAAAILGTQARPVAPGRPVR